MRNVLVSQNDECSLAKNWFSQSNKVTVSSTRRAAARRVLFNQSAAQRPDKLLRRRDMP
jgi:hypothetical protein